MITPWPTAPPANTREYSFPRTKSCGFAASAAGDPAASSAAALHFRRKLHRIELLDFRVHQEIVEKWRRLFAFVHDRRKRQLPPRARQRHVKKPPLLLNPEIALRLFLFHQLRRKFEHRALRPRRKFALGHPQDEHVRKFQPLAECTVINCTASSDGSSSRQMSPPASSK